MLLISATVRVNVFCATPIAYPSFAPVEPMLQVGSVRVLTPPDIGAMKIVTISQRGRKRDFFDLYWHNTPLNLINSI